VEKFTGTSGFFKMEFKQNQYFGRTIDEIRDLDVSLWL
jgi:hypothetical protein